MSYVTLSQKFQVVVPQAVRQVLGLKPADKLMVWQEEGMIKMLPVEKVEAPLKVLSSLSSRAIKISIDEMEKEIDAMVD